MEKSYRKCVPKASPRPFLIFANNPKQPLHARKKKSLWPLFMDGVQLPQG